MAGTGSLGASLDIEGHPEVRAPAQRGGFDLERCRCRSVRCRDRHHLRVERRCSRAQLSSEAYNRIFEANRRVTGNPRPYFASQTYLPFLSM